MMQANRFLCSLALTGLLWAAVAANARGELTTAQRAQLQETFSLIRETGTTFQAGQFPEAGQTLVRAMLQLEEVLRDADAETFKTAEPLIVRIERAHALLQLEGIVLPPFERPEYGIQRPSYIDPADLRGKPTPAPAATPEPSSVTAKPDTSKPDAAKPTTRPGRKPRGKPTDSEEKPGMPTDPNRVSFAQQIAPILISRCGGCHIEQRKGGFTLESFAALIQGPPEGVVIFPGDPVGSRLIETIETGDMPRGGGKVPPAELELLKKWVATGALFDGPAPAAPLVAYAPRTPGTSPSPTSAAPLTAAPTVMAPSGSKTVSFARQIAPLLVGNCNGCHIDAMQTRGGLRMDSFAQLLRGGTSGPMFEAGDGEGSLLVRKLRGMEGDRMPAGGRPALADEDIALISTWIDEGATLDGTSPQQPLRVMMTEAWAKNATHDELVERRRELARKNWQLAAPEEARAAVVEVENDEVLVLGNVSTETAQQVANAATAGLKKVRTLVPAPPKSKKNAGSGSFKGRITLFVFPRRYDYSEFSKMVEQRDVPAEWSAHWQYDGVDAYISLVVDQDDPKSLQARLLAPLTSLSLAARGDLPRWLTEGVGRAAATRFAARDFEGPKQWDAALPEAVGIVKDPDQLLDGKLPPEQTDLVGYGIGKTMLDRGARRQFDGLLRNLDQGIPFEDAFTEAFNVPPKEFVAAWFNWYASNRRR